MIKASHRARVQRTLVDTRIEVQMKMTVNEATDSQRISSSAMGNVAVALGVCKFEDHSKE